MNIWTLPLATGFTLFVLAIGHLIWLRDAPTLHFNPSCLFNTERH